MKKDIRKRIAEFQRLCEEVVGSSRHLIVAVDAAKGSHLATFMDGRKRVLRRKLRFSNDLRGFLKVEKMAEEIFKRENMEKIVVGMEPTGGYWKPMAWYFGRLREEGVWEVVTVRPSATAANRRTLDSCPDKNDWKDAYNVGDLIAQGKCHRFRQVSAQGAEQSRLLRLYYRAREQSSRCKVRIRQVYGEIFPELELCLKKKLFTVRWRRVLKEAPTAGELLELGAHLGVVLCRNGRRRSFQQEAARALELAGCTVGVREEEEGARLELLWLWQELEMAERKADEGLERLTTQMKPRRDYELLQSIPGVGPVLAAGLLAEIGDLGWFGNYKELISFAGLDVIGRQSGGWMSELRVISKSGRKLLRTVAYQAALSASRLVGEFKDCYQRALARQDERKKVKRKALVKVADKILRVVWGVLKGGEAYRADHRVRAAEIAA
jgi:transposase